MSALKKQLGGEIERHLEETQAWLDSMEKTPINSEDYLEARAAIMNGLRMLNQAVGKIEG